MHLYKVLLYPEPCIYEIEARSEPEAINKALANHSPNDTQGLHSWEAYLEKKTSATKTKNQPTTKTLK